MAFEHEIAYITAKIDVEPPNAPQTVGTGFFYQASLNDGTDRSIGLLISNKHVFGDPKGKMIVSLNRMKADNMPEFGNIRTFGLAEIGIRYFAHPESGC